jgi:hypothetical protein
MAVLNVPLNTDISLCRIAPSYARVYGWGASTFYFVCPNKHLGSYDVPVSTFQGFEGTTKTRVSCSHQGCGFSEYLLLQGWLYKDPCSK